jgi:protein kinase C substrate 80K-H
MHPWLLLALALPSLAALEKTHGVPPSLVSKYVPGTIGAHQTWTCLDGSKKIAWSAVNDDYCDCADGSDEPGASPGGSSQVNCIDVDPMICKALVHVPITSSIVAMRGISGLLYKALA